MKRLASVLKSHKKNSWIMKEYDKTFKDQLSLGIIEEVNEDSPTDGILHYVPHQAVITPQKETTKLRVVFDASAHYRGCPSLNEVIHQGPLIMPELYGMLLRFRIPSYAIIADVEKAFLQVRLQEADRDATRCLWIRDISKPPEGKNIVAYRFTRVTFGINASPFLLAATIRFHLELGKEKGTPLTQEIQQNLYVDNLMLAAKTTEEALNKYQRTKDIFSELNMNLREFISNNQEFNYQIHPADQSRNLIPKVLGIPWDSQEDNILLNCLIPYNDKVTKRTVSQQLASVYDPLGYLVPLLIQAKIFLQSLWTTNYTWDTPVDTSHRKKWLDIITDIHDWKKRIPRQVISSTAPERIIIFTDASKDAIAACAYMQSANECNLIMAKSKLPPLKGMSTIPKLEMNAITIRTRLALAVYNSLRTMLPVQEILVLSDSEIALKWLQAPLDRKELGVLVSNRCREICRIVAEITDNGAQVRFGYVPTQLNPADCATRGLAAAEFTTHYWWHGPKFIADHPNSWPKTTNLFEISLYIDEEAKIVSSNHISHSVKLENGLLDWSRLDKQFPSIHRATRVVAYVLRFIQQNIAKMSAVTRTRIAAKLRFLKTDKLPTMLKGNELRYAYDILVRDFQKTTTTEDVLTRWKQLNLQKDAVGIIRCYGRLGSSNLNDEEKSPIFITPNTPFALLIIQDSHNEYHKGTAHTMAVIREHYWIPQLRRQVRRVIKRCIPCQRMNNLPYKYPNMTNLPSRRVIRSRPFEHVGLDYFGPLTISTKKEGDNKVYGCIITCTTTRLIHLELVTNMTTQCFINALRRFIARRGVPSTITSDNAHTFTLGDQILASLTKEGDKEPAFDELMSKEGITWHYNTPYSPWQGGFYERLIKIVKHSLYKTLGKKVVNLDDLSTLLTEIEACLNTRPLTYQEESWDRQPILRPIDFIQKDIRVTFPFEEIKEATDDYTPSADMYQLRTRKEAEQALRESHSRTEKFWDIWQSQYLKNLREHHQHNMRGKREGTRIPNINDVVLISDPIQPRNVWKIGRIVKLTPSTKGDIRSAEVLLPNRRLIQRPVNLLIPLEITDPPIQKTEINREPLTTKKDVGQSPCSPRYNLRERKKVNYKERDELEEDNSYHVNTIHRSPRINPTTMIYLLTMLMLVQPIASTTLDRYLQCTKTGIQIVKGDADSYEICIDNYCWTYTDPGDKETIHLSPSITLHEYVVYWKIRREDKLKVIAVTCPATPFCANINCNLCTEMLANPSCWPKTAIITTGVVIYALLLCLYFLCYVPIILASPLLLIFRGVGYGLWAGTRQVVKLASSALRALGHQFHQRRQQQRNLNLWNSVAIVGLLGILQIVAPCQEVDVISHMERICTMTDQQNTCTLGSSHVLKINPFKQEACLTLSINGSFYKEIRIRWKEVQLTCENETITFTRSTQYRVLDSKRCPHAGSCTEEKCAKINRTSIITELQAANDYPGITRCVESCGGLGCDCFYPSSGCLFYRIYLLPIDEKKYEIYRCTRWREAVLVHISTIDKYRKNSVKTTVMMKPNIPYQGNNMTITLSELALPPTPILADQFVTDGTNTARWLSEYKLPLRCATREEAQTFNCTLVEDCLSSPAENTIRCDCKNQNITQIFNNIANRLPFTTPSVEFTQIKSSVRATIKSLATAAFILHLEETAPVSINVQDTTCSIDSTHLEGCYACAKGAKAIVNCIAEKMDQMAEIKCDEHSFTIPCSSQGHQSTLSFSYNQAKIHTRCEIKCGKTPTYVVIAGILRYTGNLQQSLRRIISGESKTFSEINIPDIGHIAEVFIHWYTTTIFTVIGICIALLVTYLYFTTCGARILSSIYRLFFRVIGGVGRYLRRKQRRKKTETKQF